MLQTQDAPLESILETSVRNNAKLAVTGMLILHGQHFIQALEGPAEGVEEVYLRLLRDPRHYDLKLIEDATTSSRAFAGWSMCAYHLSPADREILDVLALRRGFDPRQIGRFGALSLLRTVHAVQERVALRCRSSVVIET